MRRFAPAVALLALAPAANAAPPAAAVHVTSASGAAPLTVTLTATGDAAAWAWDFGDGTTAEGQSVTHTYRSGRWTAVLIATSATGEATQVRTPIAAYALSLSAPARATWGTKVRLTGRLAPKTRGTVAVYQGKVRVSTARLRDGAFRVVTRLGSGGPYHARFQNVVSARKSIAVRPVVTARLEGTPLVGEPLQLHARVQPAGTLRVRVLRNGREMLKQTFGSRARIELGTAEAARIRIVLTAGGARSVVETTVVHPSLALGVRGASVRALERRLRELRYVVKAVDGLYAYDTYEAVLAFQKTHGLSRTGRVDAQLWRRLLHARPPAPRYLSGSHIEVDKRRQLLLEVHDGAVANVLHVSTGATGNTPVGRWRVYRKVPGWDWVLWYPMYFRGGFAIHGYPSVPPWPASHGCVRVPMWFAPALYTRYAHGATVIVY